MSRAAPPDPLWRRPAPAALALIVLCGLIEAALLAADAGLIGTAQWRQRAYENAGFWAGLLRGWTPNYAAQPGVMFLSHSFLHTGLLHLAGNMLVLGLLANLIGPRLGAVAFGALWLLSAAAGGLTFALLSPSLQPMVGTSGALFGLAGWLLACEARARHREGQGTLKVLAWALAWVLALAALNLAFWLAQRGMLAWQAHLGGFVVGLVWGTLARGRAGQPRLE